MYTVNRYNSSHTSSSFQAEGVRYTSFNKTFTFDGVEYEYYKTKAVVDNIYPILVEKVEIDGHVMGGKTQSGGFYILSPHMYQIWTDHIKELGKRAIAEFYERIGPRGTVLVKLDHINLCLQHTEDIKRLGELWKGTAIKIDGSLYPIGNRLEANLEKIKESLEDELSKIKHAEGVPDFAEMLKDVDLINSVEVVPYRDNGISIVVTLKKFWWAGPEKEYEVGPLSYQVNLSYNRLSKSITNNISFNGSVSKHPHLRGTGYACLGGFSSQVHSALDKGKIKEAVELVSQWYRSINHRDAWGRTVLNYRSRDYVT